MARGKEFLDTLLRRARELDPTRLATLVTMTGSPPEWMQECDVVCINRYWGWYVLGGDLDQGACLAGTRSSIPSGRRGTSR